MPYQCIITGKKTKMSAKRSHSMRQTKIKKRPNLIKKKLMVGPGEYITVRVSSKVYKKTRGFIF